MRARRVQWPWLFVAALVSSCARERSDPFAVLPTQPYAVEQSLLERLARYQQAQAGVTTLSGRARGTSIQGGKKRPFKQVFALQLPDRVRIELESSIGQTLALFVCDGTHLYFRERGSDPATLAPASSEAVERTLGYELSVKDLLASLLGRIEIEPMVPGRMLPRSGDVVFFPGSDAPTYLEYGFDLRGGVLHTLTTFDAERRRRVVVRYSEFTKVDGRIVPARLMIGNLATGDSVELVVSKLTLNPPLRPEIFALPTTR
jgi:uncharacterized protein DUF4292